MPQGTTFSHRQANHLCLDVQSSLEKIISLNFDLIRLCLYWDEIESSPDFFDFSPILDLLEVCQKKQQDVIMTIGAKAPRWPEFYIPQFYEQDISDTKTQQKLLNFIKKSLIELKKYDCIKYWQVENEPLDQSGVAKQIVPLGFLKQEVSLVRSLDSRPIIITLWGNDLSHRKNLPKIEKIADIIGIDLYYKQFLTQKFGKNFYIGPRDSQKKLAQITKNCKKPVWITELQAEPWEKDEDGYKSDNPESFDQKKLLDFYEKAQKLDAKAIIFWGVEYWLWREKMGKNNILPTISNLFLQPR